MLASDSTESSNWDFSQVHDLLRSPTYGGRSEPSSHNETTISSSHDKRPIVDSCYEKSGSRLANLRNQPSHTQLGDFGSLWELLGGDLTPGGVTATSVTSKSDLGKGQASLRAPLCSSIEGSANDALYDSSDTVSTVHAPSNVPPPIITERKRRVLKGSSVDYHSDLASHTSFDSRSFSILKRNSGHQHLGKNTNVAFDVPPTPTKAISRTGDLSDTPKAKRKSRSRGKSFRNDPFSSEGSASVDSDASLIFDRPISGKSEAFAFIPSQVGTFEVKNNQYDTPPSSYDDQDWALNTETKGLASGGTRIRSTLYQSFAERRAALMTRLLGEFPGYAKLASQIGQSFQVSPGASVDSQPIHIFVDMSNILVGFHDSVKASRNIPLSTRIRRVHMSFANLALIMERERPTAKKVLVGSDRLPCVDEAERLGYEPNILERVHKIKTITARRNKSWKNPGSSSQGTTSGPETVAASGERWVEQGVDEILHLKILESLLDTDKPATIVLATGDAAVAEFSGGFMKMVQRALQRGWIVELVSFSQGTSYAYRKKEFRQQWGDQFKLVELDPYVEELFE